MPPSIHFGFWSKIWPMPSNRSRCIRRLSFIEDRTGYRAMLEQENSPEALARLENLNELMNAAREAVERGETASDFLDHAALVAQTDAIDEQAQITLMTLHNAKGLEFPVVFLAGLEEKLFPHSRSILNEAAMEEERRLCYVGMTRAEKRLILTWAKYRRRFGGGEQERSLPSRFLKEVPENLVISLGVSDDDDDDAMPTRRWISPPSVPLFARKRGATSIPARLTTRSKMSRSFSSSAA